MTNGEKYKTPEERADAFYRFCLSFGKDCKGCSFRKKCFNGDNGRVSAFSWLELEAEVEKPLPCPFCGKQTYVNTIIGFKHVSCSYCGMNAPIHSHTKEADAIAEYNRFARAVMASKEKEAK